MDKEGGGEDGQRATHRVTGRDAVLLVATLKNAVRSGSQHPRVRLECRAPGKRVGMDPRLHSAEGPHIGPSEGALKQAPSTGPQRAPKRAPCILTGATPGRSAPKSARSFLGRI